MNFEIYYRLYSILMTASKIDKWISAGYELLGTEGTDGINVERGAKILNLNKSAPIFIWKPWNPI